MNPKNCVVIGPAVMQYDVTKLLQFSDVVVSGNMLKTHNFPYAVVNSETRLQDMLNTPAFRESLILAPEKLYRKYVFFEQVDCLPSLPEVKSTGREIHELSEQSLSLMLAMWMEKKRIYLFGYDIFDLDERSVLLSILAANPFSEIFYVRKPNPQRIGIFETYDNISVIDYREFESHRNATS